MQGQVQRVTGHPAQAGAFRIAAAGRPLAGLTVLVVEDSRIASEAVRLICIRSGARIRRADCLASARRHLATYRPAVVLVDMGLPDGDGAELIAAIAAITPQVPVIIGISGEPDRRDGAIRAGAHAFLTKPLESVALLQQTIIAALPVEERPLPALRVLPTELVVPDAEALRDDLLHAATLLGDAPGMGERVYLGRFVAGVARSARDAALEDAALDMLRLDRVTADGTLSPAMTRLLALIRRRLLELAPPTMAH